jgi:hypothetical protein
VTPGGGRLHRANQILESSRNNFSQIALGLQRDGAWGQFKSTTSFVQHKFSSQSDASNALPLFGADSPAVGAYAEPIDIQMVAEDAVFTSPNVGRLQWLLGGFASSTWESNDSVVRAHASDVSPAATLYAEHRSDRRDAVALYGEASYALTDRLTATAGLRLSGFHSQTRSQVDAPPAGDGRAYSGSSSGGGASPKLALAYTWAEDVHVYVLASQGRRGGGTNTGGPIGTDFSTSSTTAGVHRHFGADELWNIETGLKAIALDGRLAVKTDLFYDIWRNIQTDQFMASGLSYTANAGDGRNIGWETELVFHPAAGLTLQATALLNRPELTKANPGFVTGVGLPGVPDISMGGRVAYRRPLFAGLTGLVTAEANYVGRSHLTFSAINSPSMGGYVLARLSAQIEARDWRLALFLFNPANSRGNTFSYGNPFNFRQAQEITPERPRTVRLVLSKNF